MSSVATTTAQDVTLDLYQISGTEPVGVDNAREMSLFPPSSPNEPVVLYDGEVVLRQLDE